MGVPFDSIALASLIELNACLMLRHPKPGRYLKFELAKVNHRPADRPDLLQPYDSNSDSLGTLLPPSSPPPHIEHHNVQAYILTP